MVFDIKILQGIAELTRDWNYRKDALFGYMCERGGERWRDVRFQHHMYSEYIKPDTAITTRLYSLDTENRRLVLRYIDEVLMEGLASDVFTV